MRGEFFGDGPERAALHEAIADHDAEGVVSARGFAPAEHVEAELKRATCMLLPSRREGYGLIVILPGGDGVPGTGDVSGCNRNDSREGGCCY